MVGFRDYHHVKCFDVTRGCTAIVALSREPKCVIVQCGLQLFVSYSAK